MGRKWIIDVLADLRSFAEGNGLPLLSAELQVAAMVAEAEIASTMMPLPVTAALVEANATREFSGTDRSGPRA